MKFIHQLKLVLLAGVVLIGASSCDNGFTELNVNPTQAAEMDPAFQLTRVEVTMSNSRYEYWRAQFIYTSCIIQHNASIFSYWSGDKYNLIDSYSSALWDRTWGREVKNLVDLMERTKEDPDQVNYNAAATVLWVYVMARMTDLYGDMPYSEAGRGFIDGILFPAYDSQADIYNDMLAKLAEASGKFDASKAMTGDVLLGNDVAKWQKFANSLRLRLGMRLSEVDAGKAETEVRAAIAGGVMESNDDEVVMFHSSLEQNGNSQVMQADDNFRLSETLINHLQATGDPRMMVWGMVYDADGTPNADPAAFIGLPNGTNSEDLEDGQYDTYVRHNRSTIKDVTAPYFHQMYAEVEFLLAEAAVRGWGAEDAAGHFAAALRAGCEAAKKYPMAVVDDAAIDDFVANNPLDASSTEASLEHIANEYWVAHYLDGMEAFANWRRTGYPDLTPVDDPIGTTGGTIPRRLYYPPNEQANNTANFEDAVSRQFGGTNDLTGRVWWDVQ
ncbi:MAG: SusD/RagB family nutrient-binding outer membrane lipoprotein [Bacteroidota bacterium]